MSQVSLLESLYQEDLYQISGKVVVIISRSWEEISEDEKNLLTKILWSVKLTLASVQIVSRSEFAIDNFKASFPACIIAFGSSMKSSSKKYEHLLEEGTSVILADELNQLDDLTKRNLWLTLKQVFQS